MMTAIIVLGALAAIVLLPLLRQLWLSRRTVVYQGPAWPLTAGLEDLGQRTGTKYCYLNVNEQTSYLAEISPERFNTFKGSPHPVEITVVKYPFARPEVESILWSGETEAEPVVKTGGDALVISLIYLLAGIAYIAIAFNLRAVPAGQIAMYLSALLMASSGFSFNMMNVPKFKLSEASGRILGIPVGKGAVSLVVIILVALLLSYFSFSSIGFLAIFPGIHAAFAVGGCLALLLKSLKS